MGYKASRLSTTAAGRVSWLMSSRAFACLWTAASRGAGGSASPSRHCAQSMAAERRASSSSCLSWGSRADLRLEKASLPLCFLPRKSPGPLCPPQGRLRNPYSFHMLRRAHQACKGRPLHSTLLCVLQPSKAPQPLTASAGHSLGAMTISIETLDIQGVCTSLAGCQAIEQRLWQGQKPGRSRPGRATPAFHTRVTCG